MRFLVFFIVLVISAASVTLGVEWLQAPMSPMPTTHFELRAAKPPAPPVVQQATVPAVVSPAAAATVTPAPVATAPAPEPVVAAPVAPAPTTVVAAPEPAPLVTPEPQPVAAAPAPLCDIAACERAYRSFTATDCTYQPSDGPRRLCTRGTPPSASTPRGEARAQATCNIAACSNAYISFNPGDCTYQPTEGPRRICDRQ